MKFTSEEYADMIFLYGKADGSSAAARRMYSEKFPRRPLPNERVFVSTFSRLRQTGSVLKPTGGRTSGLSRRVEEEVLNLVEENPTTSVRKLSRLTPPSKSTIHRIIKKHQLHPYHYTPVQALHDGDFQRRLDFCEEIMEKDAQDEHFLKRILWSDESTFNREGVVNFHNMHFYAAENPHKKIQMKHQQRFSLNVWAGVIGKR